jgi:hypothetical protein
MRAMTDPAIKAALDLLTQAVMDVVEGECDGLAITPQQARAIGAYSVVVFLRTYAPHHAAQGFMGPDLAEIAAAVERAAREASDGR